MSAPAYEIAPLADFIVDISPRFQRPAHLAPLIARLERARVEPLRLVVSVPPRHFKTETLLHFIAWILAQDATTQIVYASYAARIAEKKSRKARELARRAGVPIADDASSRSDWRTGHEDGGVWATGVGGSLTGEGADVVIVDDSNKDRVSAESALQRENTWEWFNDVAITRGEPEASFIVCQTRWHGDDLGGRLIAQGWETINLPAIDDKGNALAPARFSVEQLAATREQIGEYSWWSLYMGQPRARGDQLFGDVHFYDALPTTYRVTIGCDLAYSEKTHADYSVAVVLAHAGDLHYVVDVIRVQELAPKFLARLEGLKKAHPGAEWRSYLAGTEKGVADVFRALGIEIGAKPPIGDKFVRAQPLSASWNAGKVLLPKSAPWLNAVVEELKSFTGVRDPHDDIVDAMAAAFDEGQEDQAPWVEAMRSGRAKGFFGGPVLPPPPKPAPRAIPDPTTYVEKSSSWEHKKDGGSEWAKLANLIAGGEEPREKPPGTVFIEVGPGGGRATGEGTFYNMTCTWQGRSGDATFSANANETFKSEVAKERARRGT